MHDECTRGASLITSNDGKRSNSALGGGRGGNWPIFGSAAGQCVSFS